MSEEANAGLYEAFSRYGSGLTLVTVRDGDHDRFFVAASVMTASVAPFSLALSVGRGRDALPAMTSGVPWTLSVLGVRHRKLVETLTGSTTRQERLQALMDAGAEPSASGALWLPDSLAALRCTTRSTTAVNDQVLVVGDVIDSRVGEYELPLLRWNREYRTAGAFAPHYTKDGS